MTGPFEILITAGALKSYFLFLFKDLIPNADYEKWLTEDGFKHNPEKDLNKTHLFNELKRLKAKFRKDIIDPTVLTREDGTPLSPIEIINLVQAHQNRIDKVRLMIEHDISIVENYHIPSRVTYVVARAYWINNNGKKFRKFAKNMGSIEKVYVNKEIPDFRRKELEWEIDNMMMAQYRKDYPD